MAKRKPPTKGKRYTLWVPARLIETIEELDNKSKFLQIALDQCIGIMQFDIMKKRLPEVYKEPKEVEGEKELYNQLNPLDDLTKKRKPYAKTEPTQPRPSSDEDSELWAA